jgi:phosphoglycolate phosphatase
MDKVLIFDFDGVLANSLEPMLEYAQQVCYELGYPCTPTQKDLENLENMQFSEFGRQLGIPEAKIEAFVDQNFKLFSRRAETLPITPGMESIIRSLSRSTVLVVVTGNSSKVVEKFLNAHGLKDEFRSIQAAEDDGSRVEKILKIKSVFGGSNIEFYMIGDAVSDIRAARETGIKSIAVGWGHQSKQKLITENPDFLVDHPQDLITLFQTN